jgi:hypothetical protein
MMQVLDPEALLGLDDTAFREAVNQHVPKRSDPDGTVWAALHAPTVIGRTYTTLVEMVRETDNLLTTRAAELDALRQDCYRRREDGRRDWFQAEADHKVWRSRALGWKRALEARLMVAKDRNREARIERNAQQHRATTRPPGRRCASSRWPSTGTRQHRRPRTSARSRTTRRSGRRWTSSPSPTGT